jgi:hypothetical protein
VAHRETHLVRAWQLAARKAWNVVGWGGLLLTFAGPVALLRAGISNLGFSALVALPGLFAIAMWAWAGDGYRVHGGRGEMRLYEDRLEVPRARRPGVEVLPLTGLSMRFLTIQGRVDFIPVSEVLVLNLDSAHGRRAIAHHLVGGPEALRRVAEDIARAQRGEPPTPDPAPPRAEAAGARDAMEERLDAELAKLD